VYHDGGRPIGSTGVKGEKQSPAREKAALGSGGGEKVIQHSASGKRLTAADKEKRKSKGKRLCHGGNSNGRSIKGPGSAYSPRKGGTRSAPDGNRDKAKRGRKENSQVAAGVPLRQQKDRGGTGSGKKN